MSLTADYVNFIVYRYLQESGAHQLVNLLQIKRWRAFLLLPCFLSRTTPEHTQVCAMALDVWCTSC